MKLFKLSREIKVGLLTLLTIAAFIWGYNFIIGRNIFKSQRIFYAVYENVAAQELKTHGFDLYYFNSKKQGELDFLVSNPLRVCIF